jgi:hypothetical protein
MVVGEAPIVVLWGSCAYLNYNAIVAFAIETYRHNARLRNGQVPWIEICLGLRLCKPKLFLE